MIKAFKKGEDAPHHLIQEMFNMPHEPLTKEMGISIEKANGNDIAWGVQYLSWPALSIWNIDVMETPYEPSFFS